MGHHQNALAANIYPYLVKDNLGLDEDDLCVNEQQHTDSEFINSEFYIDESLPSSLTSDDRRAEDGCTRPLKYESSSDDIEQMAGDDKSSSDQYAGQLQDDADTVILLLQVY